MAGLKHELDQWNEGVVAFDQGLYEDALEIFEPIADSAKINFNIGVVLATLGDFAGAAAAYEEATKLDQYLAIAYFQNGVANVALENYEKALTCFHDSYLYLRGNMVIDYTQLGLDFKLYSCQVLFNRALCYIELGEMDLGMADLWRATREKQTKAHDMLDQALRDRGHDCTVFTVPQGVLYRPAESKVKNSKKKDYLGSSKVIAAVDASDQFAGFKGRSAWQVQMSGPTNVATNEDARSETPPNGLQRRATERMIAGTERPKRGDPNMGQGTAGSELSRRNTEMRRPPALDMDGGNPNNRGGPGSAGAGSGGRGGGNFGPGGRQQPGGGRQQPGAGRGNQFQDELDEIEQHVYALSLESDRNNVGRIAGGGGSYQQQYGNSPSLSVASELRGGSPARSQSPSNFERASNNSSALNGRRPSPPGGNMSNYSTSPPAPGPLRDNMRRAASSGRGIKRDDSLRRSRSSSANGGGYRNQVQNTNASPLGYSNSTNSGSIAGRSDDSGYLDDPAYAGLRDKLRVKCHYIDTRAVLVRADTPLHELLQRIQEKFQTRRTLKLKYKDEDAHMLSMIDDEDWLMAQQVHMETMGSLDRMELWCFDDEE